MGVRKLIPARTKRILLGCLLMASVFSIPILNHTIVTGADTSFHINRILSLSTALRNGDLYPHIFWSQNFNFGYGSPLFYSDFFLYPFAVLHMIGMPILAVYRVFVFLIAFFSAMSMHACVSRIGGSERSAWFSAALYLFNPFFLSNVYKRGAAGEALAYIFIPLVLLSAYEMLYGQGRRWQLLIISFCGLLLAHNITFLIMILLFALMTVSRFSVLRKDPARLRRILLAIVISFCLTAFFSLPMLEQLLTGDYRISSYFSTGGSMADSAMSPASFLDMNLGGQVVFNASPGIFLLLFPALSRVIDQERNMQNRMVELGWILLLMASSLFPWSAVTFFDFMQFPTRFIGPACALLAAGTQYDRLAEHFRVHHRLWLIDAAAAAFALTEGVGIAQVYQEKGLFTDQMTDEDFQDDEEFSPQTKDWYCVMELSTPDYLPAGTEISYRDYGRLITINDHDRLTEMNEQQYGVLSFSTLNTIGNGYYQIPKTWYKGYSADAYQDGTYVGSYQIFRDPDSGLVSFDVTGAETPLDIRVSYRSTRCQKDSEVLSWLALALWILENALKKHKTSHVRDSRSFQNEKRMIF